MRKRFGLVTGAVWLLGVTLLGPLAPARADFKLDPRVVLVTSATLLEPGAVKVLGLYLHAAYATHQETGKKYFLLDSRTEESPVIPLNEQGFFKEDELLAHLSETLPGVWLPSKQMKRFDPAYPGSGFVVGTALTRHVPYLESEGKRPVARSLSITEWMPKGFAEAGRVFFGTGPRFWTQWYRMHFIVSPIYIRIERETVLEKIVVAERKDAYFSTPRSQLGTQLVVPYGNDSSEVEVISVPEFQYGAKWDTYDEITFSIPFSDRRYAELFFYRLLNLTANEWQLAAHAAPLKQGVLSGQMCSALLYTPRCSQDAAAWTPLRVHYTAVDPKRGQIHSVEFGGYNDRKNQKYYASDDSLISPEILQEVKILFTKPIKPAQTGFENL